MADWFVVNVTDAAARRHERAGTRIGFEGPGHEFPHLGINIRVLEPGQANAKYHSESMQEDFLVLAGECILVIEEQERRLVRWDFVHCPPGTAHTFVGAGDGPCTILMVGARGPEERLRYPVSPVAARHGASVDVETASPAEAYADWGGEFVAVPSPWPPAGG